MDLLSENHVQSESVDKHFGFHSTANYLTVIEEDRGLRDPDAREKRVLQMAISMSRRILDF